MPVSPSLIAKGVIYVGRIAGMAYRNRDFLLNPRGYRERRARGKLCFALPADPVRIFLSESGEAISTHDRECVERLRDLFRRTGLNEKRDYSVSTVNANTHVPPNLQSQNVVSVCGPSANAVTREWLDTLKHQIIHIRYVDSTEQRKRSFVWRNHVFRTTPHSDFAVILVKRNPFGSADHRVVIIFGLTGVGTLGAGQFYADADAALQTLRRTAQDTFSTPTGELELLLRVDHDGSGTRPGRVQLASATDGTALEETEEQVQEVYTPEVVRVVHRQLEELYLTLATNPRPFAQADYSYELTIRHDYGIRVAQEAMFSAPVSELMVRGTSIEGDADVGSILDLDFRTSFVDGDGEIITVPIENGARRKAFLWFPVPPLRPREEPRRIRMEYGWPGGAPNLRTPGNREDVIFSLSPHLVGPVDPVRIRIRFEVPDVRFRIREHFEKSPEHDARRDYGISVPYDVVRRNVPPG
ncbi:MAG TPA: hypothetical protein VFH27_07790, partial [Longimicrobiaceae bacterium]|nr:hypothetical protein [Longimicrobiaceae bacterium]